MGFLDNMQYEMVDKSLMTVSQRDQLVEKLEALSKGIYAKKGQTSLDDLTITVQNMIVSFLQKNKVDTKKNTDVLKAFNTLAAHVKSLPTLTFKMAFQLTDSKIAKLLRKMKLFG